jgi:uncharacterized Rmd1/YagE family protein
MTTETLRTNGHDFVGRSDFNQTTKLMYDLSNQLVATSTKLTALEKSMDETKKSVSDLMTQSIDLSGKIKGIRWSTSIVIGALSLALTFQGPIKHYFTSTTIHHYVERADGK